MTPLFKKLNFKEHPHIVALDYPPSFQEALDAMKSVTRVMQNSSEVETVAFALIFVTELEAIQQRGAELKTKLSDDPVLWFCYPKASSKKYTCNFNRDTGWKSLGELGLEPVRQVAIDADWSALRFRKVEHIKKLTRRASMALTEEAKKRTSGKK